MDADGRRWTQMKTGRIFAAKNAKNSEKMPISRTDFFYDPFKRASGHTVIYRILAALQTTLGRRLWIGWGLLHSKGLGRGGAEIAKAESAYALLRRDKSAFATAMARQVRLRYRYGATSPPSPPLWRDESAFADAMARQVRLR